MRNTNANAVIEAFVNKRAHRKINNTHTDGNALYLHGNLMIAEHATVQTIYGDVAGIEITTAGWNTVTTRERLNHIPGVRVYTQKGQLYLNGAEWDGQPVFVTTPVNA